ncbi:MAG: glycosyltransferase family 2 protein [Candidatus Aminicenantes bacterium]|nr:glycosyltransferase family 2 protein [Candidatus Aminicenantes bacterium]
MMLSIVIASWNTRALLHACLASIFRHPPPFKFEVIIVDNASGDGSPEMVRAEFPAARLKKNHANLGFAAACNLGAGMASGRYLLFLNSDTRVRKATLSGAVAYMESHPGTGIMGCQTLNPDGSLQATALAFPTLTRILANVSGLSDLRGLSRRRAKTSRRPFDYVQGSFLVIAKSVFERCGGFDESFFLYGEDVDLCLRVRAAGLSIGYDQETSIVHHGGGSSKNLASRLAYLISGCNLLYKKYRQGPQIKKLATFTKSALRLRLLAEHAFSILNFRARKRKIAARFGFVAAMKKEGSI